MSPGGDGVRVAHGRSGSPPFQTSEKSFTVTVHSKVASPTEAVAAAHLHELVLRANELHELHAAEAVKRAQVLIRREAAPGRQHWIAIQEAVVAATDCEGAVALAPPPARGSGGPEAALVTAAGLGLGWQGVSEGRAGLSTDMKTHHRIGENGLGTPLKYLPTTMSLSMTTVRLMLLF